MKIFCLIDNYKKTNTETSKAPILFLKPETALLRNNSDFYYPDFSNQIEYETEIVIKICKMGKGISQKFAHRYYNEIGIGLNITARDMQDNFRKQGLPYFLSNGFDSSAPISPIFFEKDKFEDINNIDFSLKINGNTVQRGNTCDMIFSFDQIVAYISQFVMLKTGDLIYTGSPTVAGKLNIDDFCEAFIGTEKMLEMRVK